MNGGYDLNNEKRSFSFCCILYKIFNCYYNELHAIILPLCPRQFFLFFPGYAYLSYKEEYASYHFLRVINGNYSDSSKNFLYFINDALIKLSSLILIELPSLLI